MKSRIFSAILSSLLILGPSGCLSKQPMVINTVEFLNSKEKADVERIEKRFSEFKNQQNYRNIRKIRDREVGKKLEIFLEVFGGWGDYYGAHLFIDTNHGTKYYYSAKDGIRYKQLDAEQFRSVIEKSGGTDEMFTLKSKPSYEGCFDAGTYRLTISEPDRVLIAYYYCTEPPLILNLEYLIESLSP